MAQAAKVTEIGGEVPTNGALEAMKIASPYVVNVKLQGVCDLLFHRYNVEEVEAKSAAAKGSKVKKTDNIESYVYRCDDGTLGIPGEYLRQSMIHAAKYRQDPRSPRKSAMELYEAGVFALTILASLGKKDWDYEHRCRVVVNHAAVPRTRPAIKAGWIADFQLQVNLPEYVRPADLHEVVSNAGRFVGIADNRPTYGRFVIVSFDIGLE